MNKVFTKKSLYFVLFVLFFLPTLTYAATWDGGGADNNWSTCANWSLDTCPGSSDTVVFDGTSTKNSTIDSGFAGTVNALSINSGYTGIITQARTLTVNTTFSQAAGTFTGATQTILMQTFSLTGGTFTSTSGTMSITRNFTKSGSSTFNANSGIVDFIDFSGADDTTITCTTAVTFNKVSMTKDDAGAVVIGSGCVIPLGASPTSSFNADNLTNNGTITVASGTWTINGSGAFNSNLTFTNNGTITHSGSGWIIGGNFINGSSGVVTYSGSTLSVYGSLDVSQGTFPSGLTVSFLDSDGNDDATVTCGSVTFTQVIITKDDAGDLIISSGCTMPLGASPTSSFNASNLTNNGVITVASGTWTINGSGFGNPNFTFTNNNRITHSGSGWIIGGNFINGSSGVVTYSGSTLSIYNNLDVSQGTFPSGLNVSFLDGHPGNDTTLTCGSVTLGGITVNKDDTGDMIIGGSCTNTGNLTFTAGIISNPSSPYTLITQGNLAHNSSGTFGGANLTVSMEGSGTSTISKTAGTFSSKLKINKNTTATAQLSTAFTVTTETCNIVEGIFDLNAQTFTCGGTFTVEDGGTLKLNGSETVTTPTLNTGSTVTYTGDGDSLSDTYTLKNYVYSNLSISSRDTTDVFQLPATTDVNGNLTISSGTLDATVAPYNITLAGNWAKSGTFNPRTGSVILDGTNQRVTGSTSFYDLTKSVSSADTLTFGASDTQTITHTLTLNGAANNILSLRSSTPGTPWKIDPQGTVSLSYLDVQDSNNLSSTNITTAGLTITSSGNNSGWNFNTVPNAPSSLNPSDASTISSSAPTLSFTQSDSDSSDTEKYHIQIDTHSDFSNPIIDYISGLASQGSTSFTVGRSAGSGSYTAGSENQTLSDGSYYWRVQTIDQSYATSSYTVANNGSIGFVIASSVRKTQSTRNATKNIPSLGIIEKQKIIITKILKKGTNHPEVAKLQEFLMSLGYIPQQATTQYFGPLTEKALKDFQCKEKIVCSGSPSKTGWGQTGPKTRKGIFEK